MAVELLWDPNAPHTVKFDLESFFYVLVYICASYTGPLGALVAEDDRPEFLIEWLYPTDYKALGFVKCAQLRMPLYQWRQMVSGTFPPYWNPLKICVGKLRKIVRKRNPIHVEMVDVLREALRHLPLDDASTEGDDEVLRYGDEDLSAEDDNNEDEENSDEELDGNDVFGTPAPVAPSQNKRRLPKIAYELHIDNANKRRKHGSNLSTIG